MVENPAKQAFIELYGELSSPEWQRNRKLYLDLQASFFMGWDAKERYGKQEQTGTEICAAR